MSRYKEQRKVIQQARFKCENCDKFVEAQYAHIIPVNEDGEYEFENLLYLCYPCHKRLEPATAKGLLKEIRQKRMREIKNREKLDSLVEGIFDLSVDKKVIVHFGSNTAENTPYIFREDSKAYNPASFLKLYEKNNVLHIEGMLKNENAEPIIEFHGTKFKLHTKDYWHIARKPRKPRKLDICNLSKKVRLTIEQGNNAEIYLGGKLYLANSTAQLKPKNLALKFLRMSNCKIVNSSCAISIS